MVLVRLVRPSKYIKVDKCVDRSSKHFYIKKDAIVSVSEMIAQDDTKITVIWVYGVGQVKTRIPSEEIVRQI